MTLSARLTTFIDWFYHPTLRRLIPLQTFRYAVCGGSNILLNLLLYTVCYNFVLQKQVLDLGILAISPYIAASLIVFPITFFTGFWLQRHIAFHSSPLTGATQLLRYLLTVLGSLLLNYLLLKFFVEVMHIYPTPSQALTNLITIGYSYLAQKYFTFRGYAVE